MTRPQVRAGNELLAVMKASKGALFNVAVFSAVINVLMLAPALYMLQVYDRVLASGNPTTLLMLTLMILGLFALMGALEWARGLLVIRLGSQWDVALNPRVYDAAFESQLRRGQGSAGQALDDLTSLRQFATGNALFALFDAPWFPIYLWVIYLFHPALGAFALGGALLLLGLAWLNQRLTHQPLADAGILAGQASRLASAQLNNAETIEAMGMLAALRGRWRQRHHGFLARQNLASERAALLGAGAKCVRLALQSLVLGLGAMLTIDGQISAGMMIAGSILMGRVLSPIDQVIGVWKQWTSACQAFGRLDELLQAHPPRSVRMALPPPTGQLSVEQVCAVAPGTRRRTLHDLSFYLAAGTVLGVMGPSGGGKSTLARLLVGVWAPLTGQVRLDAASLAHWDREQLGPHVGYLPQDVQLFAGTIAENIARFGPVDSDAVLAAAQLADVHGLILQWPQGYETLLGEGGAGLSGGQKQRIALARALYRLPALIVLDEPNANLDAAGEHALLRAVEQLKQLHRTLILISHKPGILGVTEQLLVLRKGHLQMIGPTAKVLAALAEKPAAVLPALSYRLGQTGWPA
ncbi:MAG: type I secretion system permease/ATPase [Pseudomonas sp.]|nr:type I secretion system permease/ATPase [Pseudomonas sp.]